MTWVRPSVLGLMAVVGLVAVALAALRNPTLLWASAIFTAAVALLATTILAAIARRGRARMTWAGAAVFGWIYLLMSFGPIPNQNGVACPPFPTEALNDYMHHSLESTNNARRQQGVTLLYEYQTDVLPHAETLLRLGPPDQFPPPAPGARNARMFLMDWQHQRQIGHSFGMILSGLVGALVGRALARRGAEGAVTGATPP